MSDDPITFPAPEPYQFEAQPEAQPDAQDEAEQAPQQPTSKPIGKRPKRTTSNGYQPFSW